VTPDRLGHYEILDLLGKGGMGEVYRARDTKLGREVALKILPDDLRRDAERLARFRREAKVLASLNHPSIASIHGLEEDGGQLFLVLELAQGRDLAEVLEAGPTPVEDVLSVARQLAEGLEQAHERGVVHRDLKPANVKLSDDGKVKILDFGLARAYAGESAEEGDIGASPTITAAMTQAGTILGTAAYMSPEQARGHEVDRRSDIFAFGVILYEMLTGHRLFEGDTISDTLAEVLKTDPDLDALPDDTPVALRWLIERCLQKRPSKRLRDIGEARILLESDLDQLPASTASQPSVVVVEKPRWVVPVIVVAAALALVLGFAGGQLTVPESEPRPAIHATLLPPPGTEIQLDVGSHLAISPDGSRVVFAARDTTGTVTLWVRRLDSSAAYVLSGTEDATYPFWSPDSRKVGFFANGRLKKIDATGGVATAICDAANGRGGAWFEDERVIFAPGPRDSLHIVASTGGTPVAITQGDTLAWSHRWPTILPSTDKFIYISAGRRDQLHWRSIDSDADHKVLLNEVTRAAFADGHLFFGRDGALWARPFDPPTGEFLGEEVLVAEAVVTSPNFVSGAYSVAWDGTLVYAAGEQSTIAVIVVLDGGGTEVDRLEFENSSMQDPNLSPDGRYLAYAAWPTDGDSPPDVWIRDLERGSNSRLTTEEGVDDPVWGPEGDRIVYSRDGDLVCRSTVGSREILWELPMPDDGIPHDWSKDGRFVVASSPVPEGGRDIFIVPVDDPASWYPIVRNGHFNYHPVFSPDGEWIAYMSLESGDPAIYIRSFETDGGTWPVSTGFGAMPRFDDDGTRLLWMGEDGVEAVDITYGDRGPEITNDRKLFDVRVLRGRTNTHRWDLVGADDRMIVQVDPSQQNVTGTALELLVNWRGRVGR
jgi:serine/threonine protein kinase